MADELAEIEAALGMVDAVREHLARCELERPSPVGSERAERALLRETVSALTLHCLWRLLELGCRTLASTLAPSRPRPPN